MKGKHALYAAYLFGGALILGTALFGDHPRAPPNLNKITGIDNGTITGLAILIFTYIGDREYKIWRLNSPRLLGLNGSWPFNPGDKQETIGDMITLHALNGIDSPPFNIRGTEGTAIFPTECAPQILANKFVGVKWHETPYEKLPAEIRERIDQKRFHPPYYLGLAGDHIERFHPDYLKTWREFSMKNTSDLFVTRQMERVTETAEHGSTFQQNQVEDLTASGILGGVKRKRVLRQRQPRDEDSDY